MTATTTDAVARDEGPPAWEGVGHNVPDWSQAICQKTGHADDWFPHPDATQKRDAAIEACKTCPLMEECRQYAHKLRPSDGVWGGEYWLEGKAYRPAVHRRELNTAERREARRLYLSGVPQNELMRRFACNRDIIHDAIKGLERQPRWTRRAKLNYEKAEEMRERHRQGETAVAIAPDYGVSSETVRRVLRGKIWTEPDDQRRVA